MIAGLYLNKDFLKMKSTCVGINKHVYGQRGKGQNWTVFHLSTVQLKYLCVPFICLTVCTFANQGYFITLMSHMYVLQNILNFK